MTSLELINTMAQTKDAACVWVTDYTNHNTMCSKIPRDFKLVSMSAVTYVYVITTVYILTAALAHNHLPGEGKF